MCFLFQNKVASAIGTDETNILLSITSYYLPTPEDSCSGVVLRNKYMQRITKANNTAILEIVPY